MTKKRIILVISGILVAFILLTFAFNERGLYTMINMGNVERIAPDEAFALMDKQEMTILDIRSQEEYEVSHIPGAIRYEPELIEEIDEELPILVYCTVSLRSNSVAKKLNDKGHGKIYEITGGLISWVNQEQTLVNQQGKRTDSLHTYNRWFAPFLRNGTAVY